jgi:hypothetical protein
MDRDDHDPLILHISIPRAILCGRSKVREIQEAPWAPSALHAHIRLTELDPGDVVSCKSVLTPRLLPPL